VPGPPVGYGRTARRTQVQIGHSPLTRRFTVGAWDATCAVARLTQSMGTFTLYVRAPRLTFSAAS